MIVVRDRIAREDVMSAKINKDPCSCDRRSNLDAVEDCLDLGLNGHVTVSNAEMNRR